MTDVGLVEIVRVGALVHVDRAINRGANVNKANAADVTALHVAVWRNHLPILERIIAAGASLDMCDGESGWTALHRAIYHGHLHAAAILLQAGSGTSTTDLKGRTSLDLLSRDLQRLPAHGISQAYAAWAWGSGANYQLGTGSTDHASYPVRLEALQGLQVVSLAAAKFHTSALTADGRLFVWGWGRGGRLGHPDWHIHSGESALITPWQVGGLGKRQVVGMAAGKHHMLAATSSGELWSWGANRTGQLGYPGVDTQPTPRKLDVRQRVVAVAAASKHSAALTSGGEVLTWGSNTQGQLGYGTHSSACSPTPRVVDAIKGKVLVGVSLSKAHSVVLSSEGEAFTWGWKVVTPRRVVLAGARDLSRATFPAASPPTGLPMGGSSGGAGAGGATASGGSGPSAASVSSSPIPGFGPFIPTAGSSSASSSAPASAASASASASAPAAPGLRLHHGHSEVAKPFAVSVAAGYVHSSVITRDGAVLSWSSRDPGLRPPQQVLGALAGKRAVSISAGKTRTAVTTLDGDLYVWDAPLRDTHAPCGASGAAVLASLGAGAGGIFGSAGAGGGGASDASSLVGVAGLGAPVGSSSSMPGAGGAGGSSSVNTPSPGPSGSFKGPSFLSGSGPGVLSSSPAVHGQAVGQWGSYYPTGASPPTAASPIAAAAGGAANLGGGLFAPSSSSGGGGGPSSGGDALALAAAAPIVPVRVHGIKRAALVAVGEKHTVALQRWTQPPMPDKRGVMPGPAARRTSAGDGSEGEEEDQDEREGAGALVAASLHHPLLSYKAASGTTDAADALRLAASGGPSSHGGAGMDGWAGIGTEDSAAADHAPTPMHPYGDPADEVCGGVSSGKGSSNGGGIPSLQVLCQQSVARQLCEPRTCLALWEYADASGQALLRTYCLAYALANLDAVLAEAQGSFECLPPHLLAELEHHYQLALIHGPAPAAAGASGAAGSGAAVLGMQQHPLLASSPAAVSAGLGTSLRLPGTAPALGASPPGAGSLGGHGAGAFSSSAGAGAGGGLSASLPFAGGITDPSLQEILSLRQRALSSKLQAGRRPTGPPAWLAGVQQGELLQPHVGSRVAAAAQAALDAVHHHPHASHGHGSHSPHHHHFLHHRQHHVRSWRSEEEEAAGAKLQKQLDKKLEQIAALEGQEASGGRALDAAQHAKIGMRGALEEARAALAAGVRLEQVQRMVTHASEVAAKLTQAGPGDAVGAAAGRASRSGSSATGQQQQQHGSARKPSKQEQGGSAASVSEVQQQQVGEEQAHGSPSPGPSSLLIPPLGPIAAAAAAAAAAASKKTSSASKRKGDLSSFLAGELDKPLPAAANVSQQATAEQAAAKGPAWGGAGLAPLAAGVMPTGGLRQLLQVAGAAAPGAKPGPIAAAAGAAALAPPAILSASAAPTASAFALSGLSTSAAAASGVTAGGITRKVPIAAVPAPAPAAAAPSSATKLSLGDFLLGQAPTSASKKGLKQQQQQQQAGASEADSPVPAPAWGGAAAAAKHPQQALGSSPAVASTAGAGGAVAAMSLKEIQEEQERRRAIAMARPHLAASVSGSGAGAGSSMAPAGGYAAIAAAAAASSPGAYVYGSSPPSGSAARGILSMSGGMGGGGSNVLLGSSPPAPSVLNKWYVPEEAAVPLKPLTAIQTEEAAMRELAEAARRRYGEEGGSVSVRVVSESGASGSSSRGGAGMVSSSVAGGSREGRQGQGQGQGQQRQGKHGKGQQGQHHHNSKQQRDADKDGQEGDAPEQQQQRQQQQQQRQRRQRPKQDGEHQQHEQHGEGQGESGTHGAAKPRRNRQQHHERGAGGEGSAAADAGAEGEGATNPSLGPSSSSGPRRRRAAAAATGDVARADVHAAGAVGEQGTAADGDGGGDKQRSARRRPPTGRPAAAGAGVGETCGGAGPSNVQAEGGQQQQQQQQRRPPRQPRTPQPSASGQARGQGQGQGQGQQPQRRQGGGRGGGERAAATSGGGGGGGGGGSSSSGQHGQQRPRDAAPAVPAAAGPN